MVSRRWSAYAFIAVAISACAPSPPESREDLGKTSQAITNGDEDDEDEAVVALLTHGEAACAGTLITPYIVVTAAHCVTPEPPDEVYFGSEPKTKGSGTIIAVAEAYAHPSFNGDSLTNDIGIVALKTRAAVKPAMRATAKHALPEDSMDVEIRIVGFGQPGPDGTFKPRKRTGQTTIQMLIEKQFSFKANPSSTCNGDSGGPAFATYGETERLVGVTSSGDQGCKDFGKDMRVDAYDDFITGKVNEYDATLAAQDDSGCSVSRAKKDVKKAEERWALLPALLGLALLRRRR